jgi:broad specificity phosphatase PhoE
VTTFFLTRHAPHRLVDAVLVGRMPGASLDENGREQARRVAGLLAGRGVTAIQSSPQTRARETAQPIAGQTGLPVEIAEAVDEIDVGDWTGRPFSALQEDPLWQRWNRSRSSARPPQGESMQELQARVMRHLYQISSDRPDARVVVVSHAEVIRAALLHALNLSLDDFWLLEIAPASVSTLVIEGHRAEVARMNERLAS